jgi:pimeloyl-ACP methyl ester carboxylesterase
MRLFKLSLRVAALALAGFGAVALTLIFMLSRPLPVPRTLDSIADGALQIDRSQMPAPVRFQARDGTELAYRIYPAPGARVAILVHGSSADGRAMAGLAADLAAAGVTAVTPDMRGHGGSGARGDIGYIGQLEDDLEDLTAHLRKERPQARFQLAGHSSGGGFVLRAAGGRLGEAFERYVLAAPFLGYFSPTTRNDPKAQWAYPSLARIIAQRALARMGLDWAQSQPVIGFAVRPGAQTLLTSRYSYRLLVNFGPPDDHKTAFQPVKRPMTIFVGDRDELFDSAQYESAAQGKADVRILKGRDHMSVYVEQGARAEIVAALAKE